MTFANRNHAWVKDLLQHRCNSRGCRRSFGCHLRKQLDSILVFSEVCFQASTRWIAHYVRFCLEHFLMSLSRDFLMSFYDSNFELEFLVGTKNFYNFYIDAGSLPPLSLNCNYPFNYFILGVEHRLYNRLALCLEFIKDTKITASVTTEYLLLGEW